MLLYVPRERLLPRKVPEMSGMNIKTGYKLHTLGTFFCGLAAMLTMSAMYAIFC